MIFNVFYFCQLRNNKSAPRQAALRNGAQRRLSVLCLWRSIFGGDSAFVLVEEVETMGISIG